MRSTRSGAPPRLLPYRSPENWAIRSELIVFQFIFGIIPLLASIIAFQSCGRDAAQDLVDPRAPMVRLAKPLTHEEAARGVLRAGGRLTGADELCVLVHEYKSGKNWKEDYRSTVGQAMEISVEHRDGMDLQARDGAIEVDWSSVRWEPEMIRSETERESFWRQRMSIPAGGRLLESCLHSGDRVFIDACKKTERADHVVAGPCGARLPVVTAGDGTPRPRIDQLAASTAGNFSLLGGAVLLVLLYLWRVLGARPFVAGLIKRLRQAPSLTVSHGVLWVIGLAPIALLIGLYLFRSVPGGADVAKVDRYGYVTAYAVCGGALILGVLMRDRRRALGAVLDALRADPVTSLAHLKEEQRVTIEAEIDPRAPLSPGKLTGAPRAHWTVSATRVYRSGKNYAARAEPEQSGPVTVPIRAPGGAALLDLRDAIVDLRAIRHIARKGAIKRGDFQAILGHQEPFDGAYVLEERFLDPGEAIYIAGRVRRLAPASVEAGYRDTGAIPVIGGTPDEPLVIHAGSRRSLLQGISLERRFLTAALGLAGAVVVTTAGVVAYLIRL